MPWAAPYRRFWGIVIWQWLVRFITWFDRRDDQELEEQWWQANSP